LTGKVKKTHEDQYYSELKNYLKLEYFQEYGNEIDNLKDDSLDWFCSKIRTVKEAKKYILSFTPIRGTALDGIQKINLVSGRFLHRSHLLEKLYDMILTRKRIIHIASPAATGKTSLLQLYMKESNAKCIYLSMLGENALDRLLEIGIDSSKMSIVQGSKVDTELPVVIILDDAQSKYDKIDFWSKFVKTDNVDKLPPNIQFIVSATYSLTTDVSPIDFSSFPKLTVADFVLHDAEVEEYFVFFCRR
jgi:hypothetical protein